MAIPTSLMAKLEKLERRAKQRLGTLIRCRMQDGSTERILYPGKMMAPEVLNYLLGSPKAQRERKILYNCESIEPDLADVSLAKSLLRPEDVEMEEK